MKGLKKLFLFAPSFTREQKGGPCLDVFKVITGLSLPYAHCEKFSEKKRKIAYLVPCAFSVLDAHLPPPQAFCIFFLAQRAIRRLRVSN